MEGAVQGTTRFGVYGLGCRGQGSKSQPETISEVAVPQASMELKRAPTQAASFSRRGYMGLHVPFGGKHVGPLNPQRSWQVGQILSFV